MFFTRIPAEVLNVSSFNHLEYLNAIQKLELTKQFQPQYLTQTNIHKSAQITELETWHAWTQEKCALHILVAYFRYL